MKHIYLTIPNGDGWVHKLTMFSAIRALQDQRYSVRLDAPTHTPLENNLAHCMNDFLKGGEDYWCTIDSDNPPVKNPLDLIELDCDIIGLPTPIWYNTVPGDRPYYYNALRWVGNGYQPIEGEGLVEVDAVGGGCFIVARRVIEILKDQMPFQRQWNRDGTMEISNDYSFCQKVKSNGFRIFTHFSYPCYHFNELNLLEVIQAFGEMK